MNGITKLDKIYFAGYRLEHFTGWDGLSVPNVTSSHTNIFNMQSAEQNLLYPLLYNSSTPGPICSFIDTSGNNFNDLFISFEMGLWNGSASGKQPSCFYFRDSNNNGFRINYYFYKTVSPYYADIGLSYGSYDSSGNFTESSTISLSGYSYLNNGSENYYCRTTIKLSSSTGSSYDRIDIFTNRSLVNYAIDHLYSGSLPTPLSDINLYYSKYNSSISDYVGTLFYLVVANFDLTNTYLDYTTASSIGSTNQWSGNVSTFSTYPVSYSSTGGMTSSTNNTSVSYNLTKTLNTTQSSYTPLVMILSSNNISSNNSLYTNGYSGTYNITIPNYLVSGTGISIVEYIPAYSWIVDSIFGGTAGGGGYTPGILINDNGNAVVSGYSSYYNNIQIANTAILANSLNYGAWNQFTIFNNNGTLTLTTNSVSGTTTKTISDTEFTFIVDKNRILAGVAYINTSTIPSYPFDKASNVTSYIDFVDPNNPVVYGDGTQFTITSKTLTSITPSNIPAISISSTTKISTATISPFITDGTNSITTSDTATVASSGNNSTFYLLEDPLTNSDWTSSNIQNYQFGLTKID